MDKNPNIIFEGDGNKLFEFMKHINDWQKKNNVSDNKVGNQVLSNNLSLDVKNQLKKKWIYRIFLDNN